jgi:hypothetical protein
MDGNVRSRILHSFVGVLGLSQISKVTVYELMRSSAMAFSAKPKTGLKESIKR